MTFMHHMIISLVQVVVVTLGLVIRGLGAIDWSAPPSSRLADARTALGVLLIVLGMLCYSLLGVGYEWLVNGMPSEPVLTQAQVYARGWVRESKGVRRHLGRPRCPQCMGSARYVSCDAWGGPGHPVDGSELHYISCAIPAVLDHCIRLFGAMQAL